jgi:hypothetical protein
MRQRAREQWDRNAPLRERLQSLKSFVGGLPFRGLDASDAGSNTYFIYTGDAGNQWIHGFNVKSDGTRVEVIHSDEGDLKHPKPMADLEGMLRGSLDDLKSVQKIAALVSSYLQGKT